MNKCKNNYGRLNIEPNTHNFIYMPQLIPYFFFNQIIFSFIILFSIVYIFSKYILPQFTFQQVIRIYITKLSKKI